jgi:hypothetical protein
MPASRAPPPRYKPVNTSTNMAMRPRFVSTAMIMAASLSVESRGDK